MRRRPHSTFAAIALCLGLLHHASAFERLQPTVARIADSARVGWRTRRIRGRCRC
jgi:hypothetical protein